jgi:hypothetical protein
VETRRIETLEAVTQWLRRQVTAVQVAVTTLQTTVAALQATLTAGVETIKAGIDAAFGSLTATTLALGGSTRAIRGNASGITLGAGETTTVPVTIGLLVVTNDSNNGCGVYTLGGGTQALVSSAGGAWGAGAGAPGDNKVYVYWDGGTVDYKIVNRYATSQYVSWYSICG